MKYIVFTAILIVLLAVLSVSAQETTITEPTGVYKRDDNRFGNIALKVITTALPIGVYKDNFGNIVFKSTTPAEPAATTSTIGTTTTTAPDPIAQCIEQRQCGSDQKCRAECAGVPDPTDTQANATNYCVEMCNSTSTDPQAYKNCQDNCITSNYLASATLPTGTSATGTTTSGSPASPSATNSAANSTADSTPSSALSSHRMESLGINLFSVLILWICFAAGAWSF
ncbi:3280_t:CDS:2 [Paraglomus occultum]|uniref:3280_t:CDS:1 n=1 Tax=Paraglomus occultum TaxID=144539 RepID=A0A9N9BT57_9GLOM|nr:3280_t:CDS:2 [Paraglomus occultum]